MTVDLPHRRTLGTVLVLAGLLPAVGFALLPTLGWPGILQGAPATEALPRLEADPLVFRIGFGSMVLAGLLFLPGLLHVLRVLDATTPRPAAPLRLLLALTIATATLRTLWYASALTVFPVLGGLLRDGDADTRAAVDVTYIALNDLLSTVQEDIGVNVFGGVLLLLTSVAIVRARAYPVWIGVLGAVAGIAYLVSTSELAGIPNGPIVPVLGPALQSVWLVALGVIELVRRAPRPQATTTPAAAAPGRP